jgi:hypothetical protein
MGSEGANRPLEEHALGVLTVPLVIVTREEMLRRIHQDYVEMPDLRLSRLQAQRVWQLDERTCTDLFESLIEGGLLRQGHDGAYVLAAHDPRTPPFLRDSMFEAVGAGS